MAVPLPGGYTIYILTKMLPLKLPKGAEPHLLLCISEDITERKRLESSLRAAIEVRDEAGAWIPHGVAVLEIEAGQIAGIDAFLDPALLPRFGIQTGH